MHTRLRRVAAIMIEQDVVIINKLGLHARAAAKLVTTANDFTSSVILTKGEKDVDGKSIMSVLMLAASQGSQITIRADGNDERAAIDALINLINNRFDEPE